MRIFTFFKPKPIKPENFKLKFEPYSSSGKFVNILYTLDGINYKYVKGCGYGEMVSEPYDYFYVIENYMCSLDEAEKLKKILTSHEKVVEFENKEITKVIIK